MTHFAGEM